MTDCPTCGHPTPEGIFCVRCGAPLQEGLAHSRGRSQYAAAPRQHRAAPWLVSTLFPQLPRHSERHFRVALALGAGLVVVLAAERLFAVAMISAALLMPIMTLLYFYDVDVYRDDPAWAIAWTVGWGAVTGVAVGFLARALAPTGAALIDKSSTQQVLIGGLVVPAIGVAVMLAGPLVLLPYRRYNDTLDGATFGSASAATFAAAEVIVIGAGVLSSGLRPPGAAAPWVARLLALAVATPVLSMSAIGFTAAALWLRYRAPAGDRNALGVLGRPEAAVGVALAFVVAGAVSETFMPVGVWLAWLAVLDLVALVALRQALHIGLLEEAGEREIGPEIRCANCGHETAEHTFCGHCGIALRALPNARESQDAAPARRGTFTGRLAGRGGGAVRVLAASLLIVGGAGGAVVAVIVVTPAPRQPRCHRGVPCASPPLARAVAVPFSGYTGWQSTGTGYSLRYQTRSWSIASQSADDLVLQAADGISQIALHGVPASQATPAQLIAARRSALGSVLLGLSPDTNSADQILGTNVGLVPGPGDVYRATTNLPQAPAGPVSVALLAARSGPVAIVATIITPANNIGDQSAVFGQADDILNSIQFTGT